MHTSSCQGKLYVIDENDLIKELGNVTSIGIDIGENTDKAVSTSYSSSVTLPMPKIKKWYRKKKGKRYLPYYKYVFPTKKDIFKRLFRVTEKEMQKMQISTIDLVPKSIAKQINKENLIDC